MAQQAVGHHLLHPCPAFSTLIVLEDEKTTIFSLESFKTPYVVVIFLPLVDSVDAIELAAISKEVSLSPVPLLLARWTV